MPAAGSDPLNSDNSFAGTPTESEAPAVADALSLRLQRQVRAARAAWARALSVRQVAPSLDAARAAITLESGRRAIVDRTVK